MIARVLWGLSLLSVPQYARAAEDCPEDQVCGIVVDSDEKPLAFAEVEITFEAEAIFALTDESGTFVVPRDAAGEPTLVTVSLIGFQSLSVDFAEFEARDARLILDRATDGTATEDNSIIVTARARSRPFANRELTTLDIVSDPLASADVLLAVSGLAISTNVNNSADLQLRGGAVGLSRTYFNDVPLYEVVRGNSVDQTTRLFSIFDPRILSNVEAYPTNPPTYLANSAAGALRALPQYDASETTSVLVGLSGIKVTSSQPVLKDGTAQLYASIEDVAPLIEINPELADIITSSSTQSLGATISLPIENGGEVTLFAALDLEDGEFPLRILNQSGQSTNDRLRAYGVIGWETPIGSERLKLDGAFTYTTNDFAFEGTLTFARNRYTYANVDLAGDLLGPELDYRAGLAYERFDLRSESAANFGFGDAALSSPISTVERQNPDYLAAYAFLTSRLSDNLTMQLGTRQFLVDDAGQDAVYSLGLTFTSDDRRHRLIFGAGQYSAVVPPELGGVQPLFASTSQQVSLDYLFDGDGLRVAAGAYAKTDSFDGAEVDILGFDAELDARLANWLDLSLRFASSDHRSGGAVGDNDLGYQLRAILKARPNRSSSITGALTMRSGAVFTRVIGAQNDPGRGVEPIFSSDINGERLSDFVSLDFNFSHVLGLWPGETKPIGILAITNALDSSNEARAIYSPDFSQEQRSFFGPRVFYFGLIFDF